MTDSGTTSALPGFLAFVAFAFLGLALWFLMRNMNARMRRMSYRQRAAHRGKDDPQAGPGDVSAPGVVGGAGTSDRGPDGPSGGHGGHHPGGGDHGSSDGGSWGGSSSDGGSSGGDSGGGGGGGGGD